MRLNGRLPVLSARSPTWAVGVSPGRGAGRLEGTMALPTSPAVVGGCATWVAEHMDPVEAVPWVWPTVVIWQFCKLVPGGRESDTWVVSLRITV